jgi:hypothetical protein
MELSALVKKRCVPCDDNTPAMSGQDAHKCLKEIPGWALTGDSIVKEFKFKSYLKGLEFAYSLGKVEKSRIIIPTF